MQDYDQTASYALLQNELKQRGFAVRRYTVGDQQYAEYTHPSGNVWLTRTKHFSYPLNHGAIMEMADNKTLAYEWMSQFDVALADFRTIGPEETLSREDMNELLARHSTWVVKPESGSASHGLTLDVDTPELLEAAISAARATEQFSTNVIIQQQVEGEELRFAVLNGKVISVIQRQPLSVVGDGVRTIDELIAEENEARITINQTSLVRYPRVEEVTDAHHISGDRVPAHGEKVVLARSTMISGGASVWNVMKDVHPSYIEFIETVIARLGAKFLVVDLFTKDYRAPMDESVTYFNEFNKAPALKMFYSSRDNDHYDIVPVLGAAIEKSLEGK